MSVCDDGTDLSGDGKDITDPAAGKAETRGGETPADWTGPLPSAPRHGAPADWCGSQECGGD